MKVNCQAIERPILRTSKKPCSLVVTDDNLLLYTDADKKKDLIRLLNMTNEEDSVLELEPFIGGTSDTKQLLYDSSNHSIYLIVGSPLKIFKIELSDFMSGSPRPKNSIYDADVKLNATNSWQSSVLNDGSLLVPIELNGFHIINLESGTSEYKNIHRDSGKEYSLILGDKIYRFQEGEEVVITKNLLTGEKKDFPLSEPAPFSQAHSVTAGTNGFYFFDQKRGLIQIDLSGNFNVRLDISEIEPEKVMLLSNIRLACINKDGIFACFNPQANKIIVLQASGMG